jgi:hypothetical protein
VSLWVKRRVNVLDILFLRINIFHFLSFSFKLGWNRKVSLTSRVMTIGIAHFGTLRPQEGLGFKPNGVPNGTPIFFFSMIFDLRCQWLVSLSKLLCFGKKKEKVTLIP